MTADRTTALLVVDVQNDFCEGGALGVAGGSEVAARVTARIAADDYPLVVATRDHHIDPGAHFSDTPDFVDSWPPHCRVGTPGADFHPAFDTARVDAVFSKGEYSAAYSGFEGNLDGDNTERALAGDTERTLAGGEAADRPGLEAWLRERGVTDVDIVGIATDHCVRATALDAARAGFATRVLLADTAAVAEATTRTALSALRAAGVTLVGEVPTVGS